MNEMENLWPVFKLHWIFNKHATTKLCLYQTNSLLLTYPKYCSNHRGLLEEPWGATFCALQWWSLERNEVVIFHKCSQFCARLGNEWATRNKFENFTFHFGFRAEFSEQQNQTETLRSWGCSCCCSCLGWCWCWCWSSFGCFTCVQVCAGD